MKFVFDFGGEYVQGCTYVMFVMFGHGEYSRSFTRNGVTQITSVEFIEVEVLLVSSHHLIEKPVQYLVGITASQMYIPSGVSAFQTFNGYAEAEVADGCHFIFILKFGHCINTARTTDVKFTFVFRVEIKQNFSAHKAFFQGESTGQSCLFIYSEQTFDRTVFNTVVSQNGQFGRYSDAVVGSQGCSFGFHPLSVNLRFDGIGQEVMVRIIILFAHHVYVRLQNHCLQIFFTRCCRFFDKHVAGFVYFGF